jgi:DNA mismatch repair protein MutL
MSAYEKLLPEGRLPSYFIYFETDPGSIDVNIHPAKPR